MHNFHEEQDEGRRKAISVENDRSIDTFQVDTFELLAIANDA